MSDLLSNLNLLLPSGLFLLVWALLVALLLSELLGLLLPPREPASLGINGMFAELETLHGDTGGPALWSWGLLLLLSLALAGLAAWDSWWL